MTEKGAIWKIGPSEVVHTPVTLLVPREDPIYVLSNPNVATNENLVLLSIAGDFILVVYADTNKHSSELQW